MDVSLLRSPRVLGEELSCFSPTTKSQSHYSIKSDNTECSSFEDSASHEATDDRRPLSLSSLRTLLPPSVAWRGKRRWIFSSQTIILYFLFNRISHDFLSSRLLDLANIILCVFPKYVQWTTSGEDGQTTYESLSTQGVYTNTVVVQHHPVIQRKGDRAVQLFCFFETGDKLVTNSYDVLAE